MPDADVGILPSHIREWVSERVESGVSTAIIRHSKIVLSAIFTTAPNDQVTLLHPCKGVKTPTVPVKSFRIITLSSSIDLDSTIVEVYGRGKQGAAFGYTKVRGYHPQLATCAQTGQVLMSRAAGATGQLRNG